MTRISRIGRIAVLFLLATASARASTIVDFTDALALGDATQLGRLSRNGVIQDWTGGEPFPGVINTTTTYRYRTYAVGVGITPYIQISVDSLSTNTFVAAYDTSYLPDSAGGPSFGFDVNWLGDAGTSGNFFGTDPLFFQVFVPIGHTLVLVVNNTGVGTVGLGDPFRLTVEGFVDTEFTDPPAGTPAPVPEPSSMLLMGAGLVATAGVRRWRTRRA
jgi:hypothetical protein